MIAETSARPPSGYAETRPWIWDIRAFAEPKNRQAPVVFAIMRGPNTPG